MVNIQAYRCRHMRVEMMIVYDFTYHFPMFSAIEILLAITALEIKEWFLNHKIPKTDISESALMFYWYSMSFKKHAT